MECNIQKILFHNFYYIYIYIYIYIIYYTYIYISLVLDKINLVKYLVMNFIRDSRYENGGNIWLRFYLKCKRKYWNYMGQQSSDNINCMEWLLMIQWLTLGDSQCDYFHLCERTSIFRVMRTCKERWHTNANNSKVTT